MFHGWYSGIDQYNCLVGVLMAGFVKVPLKANIAQILFI
jgi:hypothetical protein